MAALLRFASRGGKAKRLRAALLIGLGVGLLGIGLDSWPVTSNLESTGYDLLFALRGPRTPPADVVVVAIDNDSYEPLGVPQRAVWPRTLHADLIRTLADEGARAIAFDVLFLGESDPVQDINLEFALDEAGIVILGSELQVVKDPRFRQTNLREPHAPFSEAAAAVADVTLPTERDGVIRYTWLDRGERPTLALSAVEVATGVDLPQDERRRYIDYYGPRRTIPTRSIYQALDPETYLPPGFFKDKIVFVGLSETAVTADTGKDAYLTPYRGKGGDSTYGVEIHATIAANLLEGREILRPAPWKGWLWLLLVSFVGALVFAYTRPLLGFVALIGVEIVPWAVAFLAFTTGRVWLPLIIPAAFLLPLTYVLSLLWYYMTIVRDRERIRRAFGFYLSPQMIQKIADNPDSLNLGGEEIVATAMFTDIKGFTSIAEGMTAPETAAMLNEYFSAITKHIFEGGGTLIKYIGDAVFAIWGAPIYSDEHAVQACRAALLMSRVEETLQGTDAGKLFTRIGVHTGPMLVGNLGSDQRFDYTAIGDAINLSARLEGLNKAFGTRVMVSGDTFAQTGDVFEVRPLGRGRVVGRSEPVEMYELMGLRGEAISPDREVVARYKAALADLLKWRFEEAAQGFREVIESCGGSDGPSEFYLKTIEQLRRDLVSDWDGVINFQTK
jgi:adenylate cyclase